MKLDEMEDAERLALGTLVRVMVGVDGEYSAAEAAGLQQAAADLGEEQFWALLKEAGGRHVDDDVVEAQVKTVDREPAREAIYGVLFGIAASGSIVQREGRLLDWLAETWGLAPAAEPNGE
ncbi:MAG: hypothetical protein GY719_37255 [bacterium]|nr:hypothetical protein [bacterium]